MNYLIVALMLLALVAGGKCSSDNTIVYSIRLAHVVLVAFSYGIVYCACMCMQLLLNIEDRLLKLVWHCRGLITFCVALWDG